MANYLPCAVIVTANAKSSAEIVISAYRGGQVQFGRPLIAADTANPSPSSTPTHWLMFDASTVQDDIAVYQGFANGDLPPLADHSAAWGENGLIGAADAMTAVNGANVQVYAASGDVVPDEFVRGVLQGRGLMYRPEPEF